MTLRLLALLAVAVISAVLPTTAPAQDNVLNVGKYSALATYDPHAGGLDSLWWTLNNFYESLVDLKTALRLTDELEDEEYRRLAPRK